MKVTTFPKLMNSIRCPLCKQLCTGIAVHQHMFRPEKTTKWLLPCEHLLSEYDERKIVENLFRYGTG